MTGEPDRPELEPAVGAKPRARKTFWARLFDFSDLARHTGAADLEPPPRSIPASLALFFLFSGRTFLWPLGPLAALAAVAAVATDAGLVPLGERATRLVAAGAVLGGLAWWLFSRWRTLGLFSGGLNQKAAVIETREGLGGYRGTDVTIWSGWGYKHTSHSGPRTTSILELTAPDGTAAQTRVKGPGYDGEQFLYDPRDPRRHLRVSRFGVRATPDAAGRWQVRAFGRSLALALVALAAFAVAASFGVVLIAAGL